MRGWFREHGPAILVLAALGLACFGRQAARPGWVLADADRPGLDEARRAADVAPGNDLTRLFLPRQLRIADALARNGRVPFWDPDGFGGRPLLGNPQAGLFYPPTWIAWASGAPSALGWLTALHLFWGGLGTYALCRSAGNARGPATIGAMVFQASPYLLAQAFEGHHPFVWSACWAPWAFWSALGLRRGEPARGALLAPILALAFLPGHPQAWYYLVLSLAAWAAFDLAALVRAGRHAEAARLGARWALVMSGSAGLTAIEWAPDLAAGPWTLRASRHDWVGASRYRWYPINLLQLFSARALGGPADFLGRCSYWESILSIGLVPLALAVVALRCAADRAAVRGWAALAAASVVFAAGRKLGFFLLLYLTVPGMDRFRVPSRSLFLASLGAAALAAHGAEALARWSAWAERRDRALRSWRRLSGIAAAIALVGLLASGWRRPEGPQHAPTRAADSETVAPATTHAHRHPSMVGPWLAGAGRLGGDPLFWASLAGTSLGLTLARRGDRTARAAVLGLGVLAFAELAWNGSQLLRVAPIERFVEPDPVGHAVARALGPHPATARVRAPLGRLDDLRASARGIEKTDVDDLFQIQHAADLYQPLYAEHDHPRRPRPTAPMDAAVAWHRRAVRQGLLDRMGVALLVADGDGPPLPWPVVARGRDDHGPFRVHANPGALSRAYVVPRAATAPDDPGAVLAALRDVDPRSAVLLPGDPLDPDGPRQPFTPATYDARDPDRVILRVETTAPGLLVVADTWMPGWSATLDGHPAPILRGNHAQRVVPLPAPGRHEVVLTYAPPGLRTGLTLTLATGFAWSLGLLALAARRAPTG